MTPPAPAPAVDAVEIAALRKVIEAALYRHSRVSTRTAIRVADAILPFLAAREAQITAQLDAARKALKPFVAYAAKHSMIDSAEGEIGEFYRGGVRVSITYADLRGARAALATAGTADSGEPS